MDLATKQNQKVFKVGQVVKVIAERTGVKKSRIGMTAVVTQKSLGASYWIKFQNEPEMVFRSAWLEVAQ